MTVHWKGKQVAERRARILIDALTEIDLRIEAEAKAELYPGHGKLTGTLQRSITGEPARQDGRVIRGRIATKGVRYARRIHGLYEYLTRGMRKVKPHVKAIVAVHTKRGTA